jgi:type II secretory pathway pseudopilin PulG
MRQPVSKLTGIPPAPDAGPLLPPFSAGVRGTKILVRSGFTYLELLVAFVLLGIGLTGLGPLVVMHLRQAHKLEEAFNDRTTYYLAPSSDEWARKLGAAASLRNQDPGLPVSLVTTLDNGDSTYGEAGTGWEAETQPDAYRGDHRWHLAGDGSATATWEFTQPPPGWYELWVTWHEGDNQASNAPFTVYDGPDAVSSFEVNQKLAPSGELFDGRPWERLEVVLIRGDTLRVRLTDEADGRVIADGVRVVPVRNQVQVSSLEKALTSDEVTAQVSVTVLVPQ